MPAVEPDRAAAMALHELRRQPVVRREVRGGRVELAGSLMQGAMNCALRRIPPHVDDCPLPGVLSTPCVAGAPDGIFEGGGIEATQHQTLHVGETIGPH